MTHVKNLPCLVSIIQVDCSPTGFHEDALEERVNHAHAVGALQDGLDDAGGQRAAVPLLKLVPAQIRRVSRWAGTLQDMGQIHIL